MQVITKVNNYNAKLDIQIVLKKMLYKKKQWALY